MFEEDAQRALELCRATRMLLQALDLLETRVEEPVERRVLNALAEVEDAAS